MLKSEALYTITCVYISYMDEIEFRNKMYSWNIAVKSTMVPTALEFLLYGQTSKTLIIKREHEHLIYQNIKPLEISDQLYKKLSQGEMKLTDPQVLKFVQKTYIEYLKGTRREILQLQREWSRNFAHFRAKMIMKHLEYKDIYPLCDLVNERIVPIELILKSVFSVSSNYGDHRRIKKHEEIFVDPRVLQLYEHRKDVDKKHAEYVKKFYANKEPPVIG